MIWIIFHTFLLTSCVLFNCLKKQSLYIIKIRTERDMFKHLNRFDCAPFKALKSNSSIQPLVAKTIKAFLRLYYVFNSMSSSMPYLPLQVNARKEQKQLCFFFFISTTLICPSEGPQWWDASKLFLEMCSNNNKSTSMPATSGEVFSKALSPGWSSVFHDSQSTTVSTSSKYWWEHMWSL